LSLLVQGGSLRSPRAAWAPAGPALLPPSRSSPAGAHAALRAVSHLMPEKRYVVAGAAGSTALRSHFGASLEDHGPSVVLCRAGSQTARRAGSLRGHDHSRQSSATLKPLRRPGWTSTSRLLHSTGQDNYPRRPGAGPGLVLVDPKTHLGTCQVNRFPPSCKVANHRSRKEDIIGEVRMGNEAVPSQPSGDTT